MSRVGKRVYVPLLFDDNRKTVLVELVGISRDGTITFKYDKNGGGERKTTRRQNASFIRRIGEQFKELKIASFYVRVIRGDKRNVLLKHSPDKKWTDFIKYCEKFL